MNILFLTLAKISSLEDSMMYMDLLREFSKNGYNVYAVTPIEKRDHKSIFVEKKENIELLHVNIGNYFNTGMIRKGITLLTLEHDYIRAINKKYRDVHFEFILYTTPPISFNRVVSYIKKRDNAKTYLLLKDIFPQNAVDMGMLKINGIKGLIYKYFRRKEKQLYAVSDMIGCMSDANVQYIIKHNPEINKNKVKVCPNAISPTARKVSDEKKTAIREKYGIPLNKRVFVYGGNLGRPQGIDFLIKCLMKVRDREDCFFFIVGSGTEYKKLQCFIENTGEGNIKLIKSLPKADYETMIGACDVGLIFLDHRFTIPNFPSRLLSYMQAELPVLACTDRNTDIGKIIVESGFGWWCESNDADKFKDKVEEILKSDCQNKGKVGYQYMMEHYTVRKIFEIIEVNIKAR